MVGRMLNQGLAYFRRSTGKQEASLGSQLNWAIEEARRYNVPLEATPEDLEHALSHRVSHHKSIFLDDGISGSDIRCGREQPANERSIPAANT